MIHVIVIFLLIVVYNCDATSISMLSSSWDHHVAISNDFHISWTARELEIIFMVQVKTRGCFGFGFSRDGSVHNADIVIGWMDNGESSFYDCHMSPWSNEPEPKLDAIQNYALLASSANETHLTMKFRRKLNTCDDAEDVPITNDTMYIVAMNRATKPTHQQVIKGIPDITNDMMTLKPLLLLQKSQQNLPRKSLSDAINSFDIRSSGTVIPNETQPRLIRWCHSHRIHAIHDNHIIRYEPIYGSKNASEMILTMTIWECKKPYDDRKFTFDGECTKEERDLRRCYATVAILNRGADDGFTYPKNVGYPLDESISDHYMLEIHYETTSNAVEHDTSGIRIYHTPIKRKYDAGVMSIAIVPSFQHAIPPGFKRVISMGHCVSKCTAEALPYDGINVFGVGMRTHEMGRSIKVRLIRDGIEMAPIAQEMKISHRYLENRVINVTRKVMPGDHITIECTYNSYQRKRLTLGGESEVEETCMAWLMYYPRQEQLVACDSRTNINVLLRALGIESMTKKAIITNPPEYAGRTLENHLQLYDWRNHFSNFDSTIKTAQYDAFCKSAFVSSQMMGTQVQITKPFTPPEVFCDGSDGIETTFDEINSIADIDTPLTIRSSPSFSIDLSSGLRPSLSNVAILLIIVNSFRMFHE